MSLIGGYFSKSNKMLTEEVRQVTESFLIIPSDNLEGYDNLIFEGAFGHIVCKSKKDGPTQMKCHVNDKFALIILGFNDFVCPHEDIDIGSVAAQLTGSEGEFVSLLLDRVSGEIHIINDRFSTRPFYTFQSPNGVAFSSNLSFLIHLSRQKISYDPLGLLQIAVYSHTIGTTTNLKDVKRLPPASHIVISADGIKEGRYWRLVHQSDEGLEPKAFAKDVFAAMQESTALRADMFDKGFLSLSGGLDSRLVASTIPKDADFFAFTFLNSTDNKETIEVETARQVARLLQMEHRTSNFSSIAVSDVADEVVRLTGGLQPIHHSTKTMQAVRLMAETTGFQLGGGPGDVLAGSYVKSIHNLDPNRTDELVRLFSSQRKRFSMQVLESFFSKELLAEYYPLLDVSMAECFSQLSGPTATHQITAWAMVFRQPAFTFTSPIHNYPDITEASPHLGYKYSDMMLKLPAEWIYKKNFYKYMIYQCIPQLREVIYADTGQKLQPDMQHYEISLRKKLCVQVEKRLPCVMLTALKKYQARNLPASAPTFEYNLLKEDARLLADLKEIIHSYGQFKDFLDIAACDDFLEGFRAGRIVSKCPAYEAELFGALVSICYWFKTIYDQE